MVLPYTTKPCKNGSPPSPVPFFKGDHIGEETPMPKDRLARPFPPRSAYPYPTRSGPQADISGPVPSLPRHLKNQERR